MTSSEPETPPRRRALLLCLVIGGALGAFGLVWRASLKAPPPRKAAASASAFTDVTREAGIRFRHVNGASGQFHYPETFGSGGAFLDYDRDGWLDILLVNGSYWPDSSPPNAAPPTLTLYRNNHNGTFTDVTEQTGLNRTLYGMGVAVGDYDNDGYDDLYITGVGSSLLLRNEAGDRGKSASLSSNRVFRDVTQDAGVSNSGSWGTSAAWLDYDNDGLLDLFVCNYVRYRRETEVVCEVGGQRVYCSPLAYDADTCRLYHNDGKGRFRDVTRAAGVFKRAGRSLGVAIWDVDGDRYPDILVANDLTPNYLFLNNRHGGFSDTGIAAGIAYAGGTLRAGMGIDAADLYNDGACSILISNFSKEPNSLFRLQSPMSFAETSEESGIGPPSQKMLGFGLFFFDYDNDGWQDAFVTNGHVQPDIARAEPEETHAQVPLLYHHRPGQPFAEVGQELGGALSQPLVGRGAAWGDYDNDGDLDILVTSNGGAAMLLRNEAGRRNNWLGIRLIGRKSNRDGIGAEVRVKVGERTLRDQVRSGSSYLSASDLRRHFGLGSARQADSVEVHWPSGSVDRLKAVPANQMLTIVEGQKLGVKDGAARPTRE